METFNKLVDVLSELSGIENIHLDHALQGDLGLDSLQMVTLLMTVEERFQILLNESDMNPFDLVFVRDVMTLLEKYEGGIVDEKES